MIRQKSYRHIRKGTRAARPGLFILLMSVLCLGVCGGTRADNFVPFVIPARPNADSLIAAAPGESILPGSERLIVRGGHFYRGVEPVRLWGVNLSFGANLPKHEDAPYIAARLAAAGVNAVRCHHLDTAQWPRGLWNAQDGKTITPEALDRLDFFIDQLARHGICVNLNLHVGRAHSRYIGLPETSTQYDKIVGIFTPALVDAQKQFARDLLTHVNPYRKVRYADDAAVAIVEITNEDSFFMWGGEQTLRKLPAYYSDILRTKFNAWLKERYATDEKLRAAWGEDESVQAGSVPLFADKEGEQRALDRMCFLAETEKQYFDGMRSFIKNDLRCGALVAGTIVFGPLGLYGQSDMDFIDAHAYWQHPRFPGRPWDSGNWLVSQKPMTDYPAEATLFRLAAERLAGKPFTVSEYNHPAPLDSQAECVPMIASFAAAQDWDGVWLYTYSHGTDEWYRENMSSYFDIDTNPAKWGFMRSGAILFRDGAAGLLQGSHVVSLSRPGSDLLRDLVNLHIRHDRNMLAVLRACARIVQNLYVNQNLAAEQIGVMLQGHPEMFSVHPRTSVSISWTVSDSAGLYTANSYRSQVYIGHARRFREGSKDKVSIELPEFAVLTIVPLDVTPLDRSRKILVTACGRCENTGMEFSPDRQTVGRNWGGPPVMIETVAGTVTVPAGQWKCQALGPDGTPKREVPISDSVLRLSPEYGTMWYLLTR